MSEQQFFFNLDDPSQGLFRELAPGLSTRIFVGDRVMISLVEVQPLATGDSHSHAEEQWGVLLKGDGVRIQDGVEHTVATGDFWCTPGNVEHAFRAGPDGALILDIFSPPRKEYQNQGRGFSAPPS